MITVDCTKLSREIDLLRSHVTAVGVDPRHAREAISFAAEEIRCMDIPPKQRQSWRRLVARLIGFRLARMDKRKKSAKKHHDLYNIIRAGLLRKGFAEKDLRQLSAGVTERVGGE